MSAILKEVTSDKKKVRFQLMRECDLDEVISIEESVYPYPWTRGIFYDCINIGYFCRVLKIEDKIAAYSVMSAAVEEAHLLTLVVHPDEQGKGYGKRMLESTIEFAITYFVKTMYLEVRPSNESAIALYYQRGFNEVGVRKNYYPTKAGREDALIFALDLTFS